MKLFLVALVVLVGPAAGQNATVAPPANSVNIQDLDSAVVYAITTEVGRRERIDGEEFQALKHFVSALLRWVPVKAVTRIALQALYSELSGRSSITGAEIVDVLRRNGLSAVSTPEWKNCKGSIPYRRGYTCGLWQIFHTMIVRAHNDAEADPSMRDAMGPNGALTAIVGYIEHFFSCTECSRNFMKTLTELQQKNGGYLSTMDGTLLMWQAHNSFNKQLAGDPSEDPMYPKQQFPPAELCSACRVSQYMEEDANTIDWNQDSVSEFLRQFYGNPAMD